MDATALHDEMLDKEQSLTTSRRRSAPASQALDYFHQLSEFFDSDAALARALGWDAKTVMDWRTERVMRPQRRKRAEVRRLLELCDEASSYLHDAREVGQWVLAPSPQLRAADARQSTSPASLLLAEGDRGLAVLFKHAMTTWPVEPADDTSLADVQVPSDADLAERATHDPATAAFVEQSRR